jgi:hypothetical protein
MDGEFSKRKEVRYRWKMPDGSACRMTLFDVTVSEADDVAKACGWPGRKGLQAHHPQRHSANSSTSSM